MKKSLYLLLLSFLFFACSIISKDDTTLSFNGAKVYHGEVSFSKLIQDKAWYTAHGKSSIDSIMTYPDGSHSLLSLPSYSYGQSFSYTLYAVDAEKIEGDSILVKANFKVEAADSMKVCLGVQQVLSSGKLVIENIAVDRFSSEPDWFELSKSAKIDEEVVGIIFFFSIKGNGKVWTSNWKAKIDHMPLTRFIEERPMQGVRNNEFDSGSKIVLNAVTDQMVENLEVLGKVWGFLKYYHPAIIQGKYNWDYELFRVLTQVANAKNKEERSKLLLNWIDKLGEFKIGEEFIISDPKEYTRIIDLSWLNNESVFDRALIKRLNDVKNADRRKINNRNIIAPQYDGFLKFSGVENAYPNIKWEDQGYRILSLFRLWSAVEYCFPYVELSDRLWRPLLKEYIPQFIELQNKLDYELLLIRLFSNVDDSHGIIRIPDNSLSQSYLAAYHWAVRIPFKVLRSKEGKVVVSESRFEKLQRGDVILKIEGQDIDEAVRERAPYLATSNESTLYRDILPCMLFFSSSPTIFTIERDGKEIEIELGLNMAESKEKKGRRKPESYGLAKQNIGYIDVSSTKGDEMKKILEQNTKGVILDLRIYPHGEAYRTLLPLLTDKAYPYVWFSSNVRTQVGNFKFDDEYKTVANENYYKGKVAILVNEGTQSHGEFSAMAYRRAPESAIIGSQTAGADGNIQNFYLPGNILITCTGLGTYYPNWELCQRVGVKIDIPVRPTVKGVKEGRDELLEEAIRYITE